MRATAAAVISGPADGGRRRDLTSIVASAPAGFTLPEREQTRLRQLAEQCEMFGRLLELRDELGPLVAAAATEHEKAAVLRSTLRLAVAFERFAAAAGVTEDEVGRAHSRRRRELRRRVYGYPVFAPERLPTPDRRRRDRTHPTVAAVPAPTGRPRLKRHVSSGMGGAALALLADRGTVTYADGDTAPRHVTVAYLGPAAELDPGAVARLRGVARSLASIVGAPFTPEAVSPAKFGDEGVLLVEHGKLQRAREFVMADAMVADLERRHSDHPHWVPHCAGATEAPTLDAVGLMLGGEMERFPLGRPALSPRTLVARPH